MAKQELIDRKRKAIKEIRRLANEYGVEAGLKLARQQYPDVSTLAWWRWCKDADLDPIQRATLAALKVARQSADITEVLPAAPSPAIISRNPVEAHRKIDFMARLEQLWADGELLRKYSVTVDATTGEERVKIPTFFGQSVKLRSDLAERWLQACQLLYDFQHMTGFYDAIVAEVEKESPEAAKRIMERLSKLNEDRGFTINARI